MTVLELRQYKLHPGRRDVLIELFDREFVDSQEACGMRVLGQFRDLDNPDRFVWLREFDDMDGRKRALEAFYTGPVWRAHRDAANATMIDSDDVLLLRPVRPESRLRPVGPRPPVGATETAPIVVHVAIWPGAFAVPDEGIGLYETEPAENTFPALPVRTDVNVTVWFGRSPQPGGQALRLCPTARSMLR
ncbi:NIPSNAP family protein [Allorhizocola rhizosphaerae]|uniref:NIPSNAP family protein n=1 Tax=Allorhizocola rhizosphaerae TaxID=1872709 RepID=UPI000E3E1FB5|nr:NIPSNAP family protein [Allorhizocola rhizosphaerae]